jgi:tripartite-type tricarboxylate transporter receptor subunit TctC
MTKYLLPAFAFICVAFCATASLRTDAFAQEWPTRPVKLYIPFGPGSTPDMIGRLIADRLQQKLGQPFVV